MMSAVVEMRPVGVAAVQALRRRRRLRRIAEQPAPHVVVVELLRPQHPGERLPLHHARVGIGDALLQRRVELIGLPPPASRERRSKSAKRGRGRSGGAEPQADRLRPARGDGERDVGGAFACPRAAGLIAARSPCTTKSLMPSLKKPAACDAEQPAHIGLVLAEQQLVRRLDARRRIGRHRRGARRAPCRRLAQTRRGRGMASLSRTRVLRAQSCGSTCSVAASGPRLCDRDPHQDVVRRRLGVFDRDVEIASLGRRCRCRRARIRGHARRGGGSRPRAGRRGTPPADICRASACRNGSACRRGSNRVP